MRTASFRCIPDRVDIVETVVNRFVEAVTAGEPGTRLYLSMRDASEPTRFMHLMVFDDEEAEAAHAASDWVRRFTAGLYPNLQGGVTFADYVPVAGLPEAGGPAAPSRAE